MAANRCYRSKFVLSIFGVLMLSIGNIQSPMAEAQERFELHCGWFDNPTPYNAWLTDKFGEWTISIQGGYQAEGDWPDFSAKQWVETNGHYGYGCACINAKVNRRDMKVIEIKNAYAKPLAACRKDKALKRRE
jgi:hypothetical protein